jgi:uncharacterized protein Smg (DUF494 family)
MSLPYDVGEYKLSHRGPSGEGDKMSTGEARVVPKDLRAEFRRWQTDFTLQLQEITFQLEDMCQRVEGLRDLMAPFDITFVAAVKASSETAMRLYMVVNDRSLPQLDRPDLVHIENAEARRPEIQRRRVE